jgi:hypothetical protein
MKCLRWGRWIEPGEKTTHVEKRLPPWKENGEWGYLVHKDCVNREKEQQQQKETHR